MPASITSVKRSPSRSASLAAFLGSIVRHSGRCRGAAPDEDALTADIVELASQYGRYGYRRVAAMLHDAGWAVNVKRPFRQICVANRLPGNGRADLATGGAESAAEATEEGPALVG